MKVWEGKQVVGFLLTWKLLRPQLQQQTTDKYIILSKLHIYKYKWVCFGSFIVNAESQLHHRTVKLLQAPNVQVELSLNKMT